MAITFEQSRDEARALVQHFRTNVAMYRGPGYKEAQARLEFIDPLFNALGWDVQNVQFAAPAYREVVVEASLDIEGHQKAPDYAFRIGRETKFYVEAKKPGVDLKNDTSPSYQLRRYAWSARLPLSILTDFEEFAAYDTRKRPSEQEKASTARLKFLTCEEYPDRWREVWDVFSKEAVLGGAFDQFAGGTGRRGTSEVDAEFLKEIEGWRDVLARNFALRNPRLSVDELNDAVQKTIDRVVFLRMAEDRGMEDYGRLQQAAQAGNVYAGLVRLARQAADKYDSGLFDFAKDQLTPALSLDDKVLAGILQDLYFPQSPYAFNVLPPEILGSVYERFLGKVIRLTEGHHAKVEEKPAVRKAGGVYYTPAYIVDYIVQETVGQQIAGKGPSQLRGYRVLDMACGSGSFLVGAYRVLLEHYLRWYSENQPERHAKAVFAYPMPSMYNPHPNPPPKRGREPDPPTAKARELDPPPARGREGWGSAPPQETPPSWRLTSAEKKRILTEHIFGVDIDRQAVEVTKLSLLLQVLEGETDETLGKQLRLLHDRALPDLDHSIQCGNSLIGPDYFQGRPLPDPDELKRVNPFDWQAAFPEAMAAGGFDAVIGNPPYVLLQGEFRDNQQLEYFKSKYEAAAYKIDTYHLFIERGLRLLRDGGSCSMITPANFIANNHLAPLRRLMLKRYSIDHILVIEGGVFKGVSVDNAIFVARSPQASAVGVFPVRRIAQGPSLDHVISSFEVSVEAALTSAIALFTGDRTMQSTALLERISSASVPLRDIAGVNFGKQLRDRTLYPEDVVQVRDARAVKGKYRPCYTGRDVSRYYLKWGGLALLDDDIARRGGCWDPSPHNAVNKLVTRQIGKWPQFGLDTLGYQCLTRCSW